MSTTSPSPDRAAETTTEGFQPIGSYGLLADCNSAALVDRDGTVGWLCLPRYDSPAVRPDPRPRRRSLLDPSAGLIHERAPVPAGDAGHRDDVHDGNGNGEADRRTGLRRGTAPS